MRITTIQRITNIKKKIIHLSKAINYTMHEIFFNVLSLLFYFNYINNNI